MSQSAGHLKNTFNVQAVYGCRKHETLTGCLKWARLMEMCWWILRAWQSVSQNMIVKSLKVTSMITCLHLFHHSGAFTFSVVWPQKLSKTSMDCWHSRVLSWNHTDLIHSSRSSVIQPLFCTCAVIPWRNFSFASFFKWHTRRQLLFCSCGSVVLFLGSCSSNLHHSFTDRVNGCGCQRIVGSCQNSMFALRGIVAFSVSGYISGNWPAFPYMLSVVSVLSSLDAL